MMSITTKKTCVRAPLLSAFLLSLALLALAGFASGRDALADPLGECRAAGADPEALEVCLRSELDAGYLAMDEALGRARAMASSVDQRTGGQYAVLAVEASQQAWEAYRDTACQARGVLVAAHAEAAELACAIELSRTRTEELLSLIDLG